MPAVQQVALPLGLVSSRLRLYSLELVDIQRMPLSALRLRLWRPPRDGRHGRGVLHCSHGSRRCDHSCADQPSACVEGTARCAPTLTRGAPTPRGPRVPSVMGAGRRGPSHGRDPGVAIGLAPTSSVFAALGFVAGDESVAPLSRPSRSWRGTFTGARTSVFNHVCCYRRQLTSAAVLLRTRAICAARKHASLVGHEHRPGCGTVDLHASR